MRLILKTIFTVIVALLVMAFIMSMINGNGSTVMAHTWAKRFDNVSSPELASETYHAFYRKFPDETWVIGKAIGSHGNPWGGTIITKDSTGQTRVFFGHVCVANYPLHKAFREGDGSTIADGFSNLVSQVTIKEQPFRK